MYWSIPKIVPSAVTGLAASITFEDVGIVVKLAGRAVSSGSANPKSRMSPRRQIGNPATSVRRQARRLGV
jgi:hypothetical protein